MNTKDPAPTGTPTVEGSLWEAYRRGSRFFMHEGDVYQTLRELADRMQREQFDYALIGGMALVAHGYRRFTEDVNLLMTKEALQAFRERLVGRGYVPAFNGARRSFRDTTTGVRIEVVTTGDYPGDGKPKPVVFPDPLQVREERDGLWLITLEKLIELKLASGLSAAHRLKDLSDVQDLIIRLKSPRELGAQLDESVSGEYERLWDVAQTAPPES